MSSNVLQFNMVTFDDMSWHDCHDDLWSIWFREGYSSWYCCVPDMQWSHTYIHNPASSNDSDFSDHISDVGISAHHGWNVHLNFKMGFADLVHSNTFLHSAKDFKTWNERTRQWWKPQCHVSKKNSDNMLNVRSIVHHFSWKLLENMTNRFPHIPDFAWISHALPLNTLIPCRMGIQTSSKKSGQSLLENWIYIICHLYQSYWHWGMNDMLCKGTHILFWWWMWPDNATHLSSSVAVSCGYDT